VDETDQRADFRRAIDAVSPPAPWLAANIRQKLRVQPRETLVDPARRLPPQARFAIGGLALLAIAVAVAFLVAQLYQLGPPVSPVGRQGLTPAEQVQLAALEARPMNLPPLAADAPCPDGPSSEIWPFPNSSRSVWGNGHVFAAGGTGPRGSLNTYFDVTFYTDPTVKGVVLIRGKQIDGRLDVVYVGDYAAGLVAGTDLLDGKPVEMRSEAALPTSRLPVIYGAAPGWGIWRIRQGIDPTKFWGCVVFQVDTASGSEVIVAWDSSASAPRPA
jgi:hypothetical protein